MDHNVQNWILQRRMASYMAGHSIKFDQPMGFPVSSLRVTEFARRVLYS